mgnify:FL=1
MSSTHENDMSSLAHQLFTGTPGQMGIVKLVGEDSDNEYQFELLLTLLKDGLQALNLSWSDLATSSKVNHINQRFIYVGFKLETELVSPAQAQQFLHYCKIGPSPDHQFLRNRFHPFHLMSHMGGTPPQSYQQYYQNGNFLHQVMAHYPLNDRVLVVRFAPVNLHLPQPTATLSETDA